MRLCILSVGACAFTLISSSALAAPIAVCAPDAVLPRATTVPANLPAFGTTGTMASPAAFRLKRTDGDQADAALVVGPEIADGLLRIAPSAPLVVGGAYELTAQRSCSYGAFPDPGPIHFTVAPEAAIPTRIGTSASPAVTVTDLGSAKLTLTAHIVLDAAMKPWSSVYLFAASVDGKPFVTKATLSSDGSSIDLAATGWCDEDTASRSTHDVTVHARLPFSPTLTTDPASVAFSCSVKSYTSPRPTSVASSPTPGDGKAPSNAGGGGAGTAAATTTTTPGATHGGCSIGAAATPPLGLAATLGAIAAVAALLGRRGRRSEGGK